MNTAADMTTAQESAVSRISAVLGAPVTLAEAQLLPMWAEYHAFAAAYYAAA